MANPGFTVEHPLSGAAPDRTQRRWRKLSATCLHITPVWPHRSLCILCRWRHSRNNRTTGLVSFCRRRVVMRSRKYQDRSRRFAVERRRVACPCLGIGIDRRRDDPSRMVPLSPPIQTCIYCGTKRPESISYSSRCIAYRTVTALYGGRFELIHCRRSEAQFTGARRRDVPGNSAVIPAPSSREP